MGPKYEKLDRLILQAIKTGKLLRKGDTSVSREARVITQYTPWSFGPPPSSVANDAWNLVSQRLQSLRKRGLIVYAKGSGWQIAGGTP